MIFSAKWQVKSEFLWQSAVSGLIRELEGHGCVVYGEGTVREICVPGLDEQVMAFFGNEGGLLHEDWKIFVQRHLWDRAQIFLRSESRLIEYQWTYWTPLQITFHLLMGALFFGTHCSIEWVWLLFVPTVFAFADAFKLSRVFSGWHGKCFLAKSMKADR